MRCCMLRGCGEYPNTSALPSTMPKPWTTADIPPLTGKLALVTGATGGLGYETALGLAGAGAAVILAGRNEDKGKDAISKIRAIYPDATIEFGKVDLASLSSISEFANGIKQKYENKALDILVNNAGVMAPPKRETTVDGFELQFGTNYLSHFSLTAQLLPMLKRSPAPRVVALSSVAHRHGKIRFKDLQWERSYNYLAYPQSKVAMLMFALELQRRSDAAGWGITSTAAHPGISRTELFTNGPRKSLIGFTMKRVVVPLVSHSAAAGALPSLFAATSPAAVPGGYYGPSGLFEYKGSVAPAKISNYAKDLGHAAKLWDVSLDLCEVKWE